MPVNTSHACGLAPDESGRLVYMVDNAASGTVSALRVDAGGLTAVNSKTAVDVSALVVLSTIR